MREREKDNKERQWKSKECAVHVRKRREEKRREEKRREEKR